MKRNSLWDMFEIIHKYFATRELMVVVVVVVVVVVLVVVVVVVVKYRITVDQKHDNILCTSHPMTFTLI